ncbi:unnamed protein product [Sphagnum balticum]
MSQRQPLNSLYGFPTPLNNQALPPIVSLRTPTTTDYAPIGQSWIYTTGNAVYILVSIVSNVAQWNLLEAGGAGGNFTTLTSTGATTLATTGASVNTFGTLTIGGAAQTGTITLGSSSGTNIVDVGTGAGATTVNIANGAAANQVVIGSTAGAAKTTLQAGTGGVVLAELRADPLRSLASGSISGAYAAIGTPFAHPVRIMIAQNLTDVTLTYSFDSVNDHFVLPAGGQMIVDVSSDEFQGNSGGAVPPTAGNINIVGATGISVVGNPGTSTLTISGSAEAGSFVTNSGTATPAGGIINVIGGVGISTAGSGNTVTISASNYTYTGVSTTPYVVLTTDEFLGVATNALAITVQLPNAPATGRIFVIKDTTGEIMAYKERSPIPVIEGGTGAQTLTLNGVLLGNGTSAITANTPGLTGQVLTGVTGSAPTFQSLPATSISITGDSGGALTGSAFTFTGSTTGLVFNGAGTTETLGGTLVVSNGGTGATTLTGILTGNGTSPFTASTVTQNGVLYGGASNAVVSTAVGATNTVLLGNTAAAPSFGQVPNGALVNSSVTLSSGNNITVTGGSPLALGGTATIAVTGTTTNAVQIGNVSGSLTSVPVGLTGQVLTGVTGGAPTFQAPAASSISITGTLVVSNGGTGKTSFTAYAPIIGGTTTTGALQSAATGIGTAGFVLTSTGSGSAPTFQAPAASSITINGNSGSATGSTLTITTGASDVSGTSKFTGSGSTVTQTFTDTQGNTAIGLNSFNATYGAGAQNNTAYGEYSMGSVTSGQTNSCFGYGSGYNITSGSYNTMLGYQTGEGTTTTQNSNIYIGFNAGYGGTPESNTLRIGNGTGSSTVGNVSSAFICGINGVNVGSVAKVVTMASDQLGTATITAGTGITVTPTANTITIASTGISSISITGDSGGALIGSAFTFTGSTTGLVFNGAGTTETLSGTLVVSNGGTGRATLTNHGVLVGAGTSAVTQLAVGTNGQVLLGSSAADPVFGTLTSTGGTISFTTGAGSLNLEAVAGASGLPWTVVTANQTAAVNNGYFCNKAGTLALALPATSAVGTVIEVANINTATGTQFTQAAGQQIFFGNTSTTSGATGAAVTINTEAADFATSIGNTTGSSALTMKLGTGNFSLDGVAGSTYTVGASTTTGTYTLGGTAQTGTITLGSSSGTNIIAIGAGSGATTVNIANAQTGGAVNIGASMTTGTIAIGGTGAQTGTITIGGGTGAQTVNLGTGGTGVKTIHIGDSAVANVITIGNGTNYKIVFDTVGFDQSSSVSSGVFTAPVAGRYFFYGAVQFSPVISSMTTGYMLIVKNSFAEYSTNPYVNPFAIAAASPTGTVGLNGSQIFNLAANDTVSMYVNVTGGTLTVGVSGNSVVLKVLIALGALGIGTVSHYILQLPNDNIVEEVAKEATTPPQLLYMHRDPTTNDNKNVIIGTFWIYSNYPATPKIYKLWQLVDLTGGVAKWIQLYPVSAGDLNFITDTGTASPIGGDINFTGDPAQGTFRYTKGAANTVSETFTDANSNVAVGANSQLNRTSSMMNTSVGSGSLQANVTSNSSTAFGAGALQSATSGPNDAYGTNSLNMLVSGTNNISIGNSSSSTYVGAESNNVIIGNAGFVGQNNAIMVGQKTATAIYIGGSSPVGWPTDDVIEIGATYVALPDGINGVNLTTANVVTSVTGGQLGSALITGSGGVTITTPSPNVINIAGSGGGAITLTGDSGGGLTGSSFTLTGASTGLTLAGSGTTLTLGGTLLVPSGGTGKTSFTAYAPIVGGTTTTGALQSAATGISNVGYVLTSTGAGSVPTFQAVPGGGSGALNLIATQVPVIGPVTFAISPTYLVYFLTWNNVSVTFQATKLLLQLSTDGGSTYFSTGYVAGCNQNDFVSASFTGRTTSTAGFVLSQSTGGTATLLNGSAYLYGLPTIGYYPAYRSSHEEIGDSTTLFSGFGAGGYVTSALLVNSIQISIDAGTMTGGSMSLYGLSYV